MAPVVALTGFMGSGKTTVGRKTARLLGWEFIDLDREVAAAVGKSIPEIFSEEGEVSFRRREGETLRSILTRFSGKREGVIVALGGGTVTDPRIVEDLKQEALVVYLQTDAARAWRRVAGSDRPLARDRDRFISLLKERRSVYEGAADRIVDTRGTPLRTIVDRVVAIAREYQGGRL